MFGQAGGASGDCGFITGMDEGGGNVTKVIFIPPGCRVLVFPSVLLFLHFDLSLYRSAIVLRIF